MKNVFRITAGVCMLLVIGLFTGCSDDSSTPTDPPPPTQANEGGNIGIYMDTEGTNSTITADGTLKTLHVVHHNELGARASSFMVEAPAGWTFVAEAPQHPVSIGSVDPTDSYGISIAYSGCMTGAIHTMTLFYQSPATSQPGDVFKVVKHGLLPEIQVVNCDEEMVKDAEGNESPVH
jgi:hypothetical protein